MTKAEQSREPQRAAGAESDEGGPLAKTPKAPGGAKGRGAAETSAPIRTPDVEAEREPESKGEPEGESVARSSMAVGGLADQEPPRTDVDSIDAGSKDEGEEPASGAGAERPESSEPEAQKRESAPSEPSGPAASRPPAASVRSATGPARGQARRGTTTEVEREGVLLARRYRLERVLGRGGMGTVWRALDETLGRTVAVKELRFPTGIDEDEKRRLITRTLREAKAIARIRSGGAVTVFDVVDVDDRPWIVMELIEGASLAEVIRERGTLTPRRAAEVGLAVLDVLRAAHLEGILHRDVKPSNVLIADTGRVVLTDFGIAQVEGDPSVTSTGMLVGAPSYISPERARGQKPGPPADMWSLGGLLYASVEGVPPYDKGSALATLTAVMTDPVDPPKNAGPLADVIYGLLAKDPDQRLDEAGARAMLTAVLDAPEAEPPADRTRVVELPPVPSEPVRDPKAEKAQKAARDAAAKAARDAAKEAAREAVKAAKAAKEKERQERARAAARPAVATGAAAPAGPKRPVPAPLTDVMPRRTIVLALAAFLAVLVVIGSLVVYAFSGDDEPGVQNKDKRPAAGSSSPAPADGQDGKNGDAPAGQGGADPGAAAQGSAAGGADGQEGGQGGAAGTGSDPKGSAAQGVTTDTGTTTTAEGGTAGGSVPAGYATVTDTRFHFTMAMPEGFRRTKIAGSNSGGIYSRDGGFPRVQVDYNASPTDDAALAWNQLEPAIARSSTAYRLIGITKTSYNGYPTVADWQFERTQGGVAVRVLNRGFKVDATHGYAIMISCKASEWDGAECRSLRETAFATFQPKD